MRRRDFLATAAGAAVVRGAEKEHVELTLRGRAVTSFHFGSGWDKPFLYPLRSVSGRAISRGYPIEKREGEATDHPWHRGVWYGHGIINGADFWREQGPDKAGRFIPKAPPAAQGDRITVDLSMMPPGGKSIGTVRQSFRVADRDQHRFIDATITLLADAGTSLTLGDTDDGGFAYRLADEFREDRGAKLRNSEGLAGTKNIWGKSARWVDYSAVIAGVPTGAAIFDHPSNFRHPTRWHARGYSLNAANPFALRSFTKEGDGSHSIPAGASLRFRYRIVIHEGGLQPAGIEKLYREFAAT
jgi:hypothetical protein